MNYKLLIKMKTRILLIVLLGLLGFSGKGQKHLNCGYPIHVKADSLFNYVFSHSNNKGSNLRDIYDYSIGNKLDSVYGICQDYMINKLGKDIYCGYVTLQFEGFKTSKRGCYGFSFNWLEYSLELPGLPGNGSIGKTNIPNINEFPKLETHLHLINVSRINLLTYKKTILILEVTFVS